MRLRPPNRINPSWPCAALLLFALQAGALEASKSADDFFHGGAMNYLSNNIPAALDIVTDGLQRFPDDEKLKRLEALLQQQQQQQNQNQEQQQDPQQSDQQQQQPQQNDHSQESKQEQKDAKDPQQADQKNTPQESQAEQNPREEKSSGEQQQASGQPDSQEQMTPEQALRVLDTTKGDEALLPLQKLQPPPASQAKFKDW